MLARRPPSTTKAHAAHVGGGIRSEEEDGAGQLVDRGAESIHGARQHGDLGTVRGEYPGRGAADPRGRTADKGVAPLEAEAIRHSSPAGRPAGSHLKRPLLYRASPASGLAVQALDKPK